MREHDRVLNLLHAVNVLLPAAVTYTAFSHEVLSLRFALTRAVVLSVVLAVVVPLLHLAASAPVEHFIDHRDVLRPLALPVSLIIAAGFALVRNPLHNFVERMWAPRWHRAKRELQGLAQQFMEDDALTDTDVDRVLVQRTTPALWLQRAALFVRERNGRFVLRMSVDWPDDAVRELDGDHAWARREGFASLGIVDADDAIAGSELVVPIRRSRRQPASHLVVYSHHAGGERMDPDEVRVVAEVARAAAFAYMRIELEAHAGSPHARSVDATRAADVS